MFNNTTIQKSWNVNTSNENFKEKKLFFKDITGLTIAQFFYFEHIDCV